MIYKETIGFWGGMGEGERRRFAAHLRAEGYLWDFPPPDEFRASLVQFYHNEGRTEVTYENLDRMVR